MITMISTPFVDTAIFIVALVGVLVALAAIGMWAALGRILHEDIARDISQAEEATRTEALSRMAATVADSFWVFYKDTGNIIFRDEAMKILRAARETLEGRGKMAEKELKCRIYNNLAFVYAENGKTEDTTIAHFLVDYVRANCKDFPKYEVDWLETYAYVLYRLPKKRADNEEALAIINELLERPDTSEEDKRKYKERYSISGD